MKLVKTLFCLGLWAVLGLGITSAQESYEHSITVIPFAQDTVEESIEGAPFTEEETDGTTIGTVLQEQPKEAAKTVPFLQRQEQNEEQKKQFSVKATPYQQAIIDALIFGSAVQNFLEDGSEARNQLIQKYPALMEISLNQLDSEYAKNQIKADKKYKDKWLLVAGTVGKIRDNKNPEIGPTMILHELQKDTPDVITTFKDQDKAREILAELENGQITSLVCQVDDYEGADIKLKNCEFFHDLLLEFAAPRRAKMIEAVEGRGDKKANASTAFIVIMAEKVLGPEYEKKCEEGPEACLIGLSTKEANPQLLEQKLPEVLSELNKLGYTKEMLGDGSEVEKEMADLFQ